MRKGMRHAAIGNRNFICYILHSLLFALGSLLLAPCLPTEAQQREKIPRIGVIFGRSRSSSESLVEGFRQGLRDRGYVEEKNIIIDYRYGEGREDLLRDFAGDLVRLKVDIIVTASTVAAVTAKQLTGTIPIVVAGTGDPVATGSSPTSPGREETSPDYPP
jgi:putative ABC transport system substrate-binding protein